MKFSLHPVRDFFCAESDSLELQNPFIFFASLIMGSALLPMASSKKELALLGGTFIFGLSALEMVLRIGGY